MNDLEHYLTEVRLLKRFNEAPTSEIFVTAKNKSNYFAAKIMVYDCSAILARLHSCIHYSSDIRGRLRNISCPAL